MSDNKYHASITFDKLSVDEASEFVLSEKCGGTSIFVGTTRNNFKGKKVMSLEYECYDKMASKQFDQICVDIRAKYPDLVHIYIKHRLGVVPLCESSIIVATSSAHRNACCHATSELVSMVKSRVPIWKKEVYADGSTKWMENKECSWCNKHV